MTATGGPLGCGPDLDAAARLVTMRATEIDSCHDESLNHAIDRLEERHPIAATIMLRARIDSVLARASSTQYGHAARDLAGAAALAPMIEGAGPGSPHARKRPRQLAAEMVALKSASVDSRRVLGLG